MSTITHAPDWNLPKVAKEPVPIESIHETMVGPFHKMLLTRTYVIYALMCIIGILPSVFARFGVAVSPKIQTLFFGLWFPGAGLISTGRIPGIVLGIVFILFTRKFAVLVWRLSGLLIINVYLWVVSAIGAPFLANRNTPYYTWIINAVIVAIIIYNKLKKNATVKAEQARSRAANIAYTKAHPEEFVVNTDPGVPMEDRELTPEQLAAIRFVFDTTLNRKLGDFSGFEESESFQSSALRYTLDHLGYTLMTLQGRYLPNFHGYLNDAQRFVIDSLTEPAVVSYWKWEYFANFLKWDPDPIKNYNIMFSGWSGILPISYTRVTGDTRYEEENSIRFRTSKNPSARTYDYNNEKWAKALVNNFENVRSNVVPCEPHFVFPYCNAWGCATVLSYDRYKGTNLLASVYPKLEERFQDDWSNPDGTLCVVKNTLFGSYSGNASPNAASGAGFAHAKTFNAFDPVSARREYILNKNKWFYRDENGELKFRLGDWDKLVDGGNFKPGCGYNLSYACQAAREMGDDEFAEELLQIADKYLKRAEGDTYYYTNASVISNATIALCRFARVNDFAELILNGSGHDRSNEPILDGCSYPDVLVAKAYSHGEDLNLVLYNGKEPGSQELTLGRLVPGAEYKIVQTQETFKADENGRASIHYTIDGRTPIDIVRS